MQPLNRPTLWVTRAQPQADAWVRALGAAGWPARAVPLIAYRSVADPGAVRQAWQNLARFHAVMFVSAQAVAAFFEQKQPPDGVFPGLADTKIRAWCTGPGTRAALLRQGWPAERIDSPSAHAATFDSEALWAQVAPQVHPGQAVLLVRGRSVPSCGDPADPTPLPQGQGREWLTQQLLARGVQVQAVAAYERCLPQWAPSLRQEVLQARGTRHIWLLASAEAVANLERLLPDGLWTDTPAVVIHPRQVAPAQALGFAPVRVAAGGDVAAVLASIKFFA